MEKRHSHEQAAANMEESVRRVWGEKGATSKKRDEWQRTTDVVLAEGLIAQETEIDAEVSTADAEDKTKSERRWGRQHSQVEPKPPQVAPKVGQRLNPQPEAEGKPRRRERKRSRR